jgi:hypothetical protein
MTSSVRRMANNQDVPNIARRSRVTAPDGYSQFDSGRGYGLCPGAPSSGCDPEGGRRIPVRADRCHLLAEAAV